MRKTKIVYASSAMLEEDFSKLFKDSKNMPGQQAQRFNRLMIKGFEKNELEVCAVSAPPVTRKNCSKKIVTLKNNREGNAVYRYLPIVNAKGVKNLSVMVLSFFETLFALIGKKGAVVCDVLNISVATGAVWAGRFLHKECVGVVTDVPELMVTGHSDKQVKYCHKLIEKCTSYVFLTEAMNDRLNPSSKPYTIVEGVCNEDLQYDPAPQKQNKTCFYAGLLDAEYGVKNLVEAFIKADVVNSQLKLCGKGPYTEELMQVCKEHPNVEYLGVLFNTEVVELERQATLLINPRPSGEEFTKFSFPSKIMEYMTTGTAVLATRLSGIPEEYYDYIFTFSDETVDGMADDINKALSLPDDELAKKGESAYRFVTEQKSAVAQAKKVIELIGLK